MRRQKKSGQWADKSKSSTLFIFYPRSRLPADSSAPFISR